MMKPRKPASMPGVRYTPPQPSPPAASTPIAYRASPWTLFAADLRLAAHLSPWLPYILIPLRASSSLSELYPNPANVRDSVILGVLLVLGVLSFTLTLLVGLVATGWFFLAFVGCSVAFAVVVARPLNAGPRVVVSALGENEGVKERAGERWVFVNGVCCGDTTLLDNINMISDIFKRPVTGIHNHSYGLIFDLVECMIQRDFSYITEDIRITYNHLKSLLLDPEIKKLILIGHSQGGIIVAAVLDVLFSDLPQDAWQKLEVYTFGCAANHFDNPTRFLPLSASPSPSAASPSCPTPTAQIRYIEHYANEHDFVAMFGVLHFVRDRARTRYAGRVFTRLGATGHLLNNHYLSAFRGDGGGDDGGFLQQAVEVDWALAGDEEGAQAEGRTVAELSRLWRYRGGGSPE